MTVRSATLNTLKQAKGRLLLGVNDNELNDNSGYFSVVVTKQ
jgi:hypothetical protein